MIILVMREFCN